MNSEILKIAIPSIVSNITVPLLGLIDVMIVGHMGNAAYIGAIAIGSMIFNVICWVFGFLRMGTSGMASQAYGKGDDDICIVYSHIVCAILTIKREKSLFIVNWCNFFGSIHFFCLQLVLSEMQSITFVLYDKASVA